MSTPPLAGAGPPPRRRFRGLAYKIGATSVAVGALMCLASGPLGGAFFDAAMWALPLLGAPEDRSLFSPYDPQAGPNLIVFLGLLVVGWGAATCSLRLLLELLGLAGRPVLTNRMNSVEKTGFGALSAGVVLIVAAGSGQSFIEDILFDVLLFADSGSELLGRVAAAGVFLFWGGVLILMFRRWSRLRALTGWSDRFGWGRLGLPWANTLGLALTAAGAIGLPLGVEGAAMLAAAGGIGVLVAGVVLGRLFGRPP